MPRNNTTLTIGELSRRTGVAPSALRYHESLGILPAPQRVSSQRRYEATAVDAVRFIQAAQLVGFTLHEIRAVLENPPGDQSCCTSHLQDLARKKIREVDDLIERATAMKKILQAGLTCQCSSLDNCLLFISTENSE